MQRHVDPDVRGLDIDARAAACASLLLLHNGVFNLQSVEVGMVEISGLASGVHGQSMGRRKVRLPIDCLNALIQTIPIVAAKLADAHQHSKGQPRP